MTRSTLLACTAALALIVTISAAMFLHADDAPKPQWYKGNLHTHSLWSDGNEFPEVIADWYTTHGYHFLALSDHNILSDGQKWINLRGINLRGNVNGLQKYQERFGAEWVELRGENEKREVRLRGLAEFRGKFEKPGQFLMIQSEEITDKFELRPVHINATNIQELIKPQGGKSVREVMQRNLEKVKEQADRTGKPILPHVNHPNFVWGISGEDLAAVLLERFFEVYNGHPSVNQEGDPVHASIERVWDIANALRIVQHKSPPLYGIGTDDSHAYHAIGQLTKPAPKKEDPAKPQAKDKQGDTKTPAKETGPFAGLPAGHPMRRAEPGRGWVMVRAAKLDAESLIEAMMRGDFYASSGVTLADVGFKDGEISITIEPDGDAQFTTQFIGTLKGTDLTGTPVLDKEGKEVYATRRYSAEVGKVLAEVKGLKPSYKLTGDELYVRAVISSNKPPANPSYKRQVKQAWTQPVGWEKWIN